MGFSLAIVDDEVVGDDPSVRDRKRAEVYGRWLALVRDDDFVGVQNYERNWYDGTVRVGLPPPAAMRHQLGSARSTRLSLAGAVRYAHAATGVPVLVTEHGLHTATTPTGRRSSRRRWRGCSTLSRTACPSPATCTGR